MEDAGVFFHGIIHDAIGACPYDCDGKIYVTCNVALLRFCYGSGRSGDGDYWGSSPRRHEANTFGLLWRSALLDRMGGIPVYVLCAPLRGTTGNRKRRSGYQTGIFNSARNIRPLGNGYDIVHV